MHSPQLLVFKDRAFKTDELELIHEVVDSCPRLSRQELANTVCELLGWRRANGGLKTWECKQLLEHLEQARGLGLPPLRETKPRGVSRRLPDSAAGEAGEVLRGRLREVAPVQLSLVEQPRERRLWRELVDRYHYLGYKMAFGARLQYLVQVQRPRPQVVACVQFSSPAGKRGGRWWRRAEGANPFPPRSVDRGPVDDHPRRTMAGRKRHPQKQPCRQEDQPQPEPIFGSSCRLDWSVQPLDRDHFRRRCWRDLVAGQPPGPIRFPMIPGWPLATTGLAGRKPPAEATFRRSSTRADF